MPHYNIQPGKRPPLAGTEPRLINSPGTGWNAWEKLFQTPVRFLLINQPLHYNLNFKKDIINA